MRQRARLVEHWQDARHVGIGNRLARQASRDLLVAGERRRQLIDLLLVVAAGMPQQAADDDDGGRRRGEGTAAQQHTAPCRAGPLGSEHRLAEDHLAYQAAEKIAAALLRAKARRATLIDAEG